MSYYQFENTNRRQRVAIAIILACGIWTLACVLIWAVA